MLMSPVKFDTTRISRLNSERLIESHFCKRAHISPSRHPPCFESSVAQRRRRAAAKYKEFTIILLADSGHLPRHVIYSVSFFYLRLSKIFLLFYREALPVRCEPGVRDSPAERSSVTSEYPITHIARVHAATVLHVYTRNWF